MVEIPELTGGPCWHGDSRSCMCEEGESASEAGKALASLRRRTVIACVICGKEKEVWQRKSQQPRTCSPACRQKLWRHERKTATTRSATHPPASTEPSTAIHQPQQADEATQ